MKEVTSLVGHKRLPRIRNYMGKNDTLGGDTKLIILMGVQSNKYRRINYSLNQSLSSDQTSQLHDGGQSGPSPLIRDVGKVGMIRGGCRIHPLHPAAR
jgi:hypothetical protein